MEPSSITFSFFLIFSGAAVFASLALYTRQPLIIAYIALGACIGPYGLSMVTDLNLLSQIGHIGIIFLLFLLGLDMQPQALWSTLRKSSVQVHVRWCQISYLCLLGNRVKVHAFLVILRQYFQVVERFRFFSFVREPYRRLAHIQLAGDDVGNQTGAVFAEEGDFTCSGGTSLVELCYLTFNMPDNLTLFIDGAPKDW